MRRRAAAGEQVFFEPGLRRLTRAGSVPEARAIEEATGLRDKTDLEFQAEQLDTTPEAAARLNTWQGRLENALAKSAAGQTALRVEQGLSDLAATGISLVSRAAGREDISNTIHKEQQDRDRFLQVAERGGDLENLMGAKGSSIYGSVARSVSKIGAVGLAGPLAVYSTIGGESYDRGLAEFGENTPAAQSFAMRKAGAEVALTALFGQIGKRFGLQSTEEVLSKGVQNAVSKIGQRIGLADKLKRAVGGAALEAGEEVAVDAVQQAIERAEQPGRQPVDVERMLTAGLTGAVARGVAGAATASSKAPLALRQAAHAIQGSLKKHKGWITETVKGTVAAQQALQATAPVESVLPERAEQPALKSFAAAGGREVLEQVSAPRTGQIGPQGRGARKAKTFFESATPTMLEQAAAAKSEKEFREATGLKRTTPTFRTAFQDTLKVYGQVFRTPGAEQAAPQPVQPIAALRVADQEPPPPNNNESIRWGEDGYLAIPITPSPSTRRVGNWFRENWAGIGQTLTTRLHKQASKFTDPTMKFHATRMADDLAEIGRKVNDSWHDRVAEISPEVDALKKMAGSPLFNTAVGEAQRVDNVETTENGRSGTANIVEWVEGARPTTGIKSKRLRDFVDKHVAYTDKKGNIIEGRGVRRFVPERRREQRAQELDALDDAALSAEFARMFPEHEVPKERDALLRRLAPVEFFRNPGGNIWTRMALPDMNALMQQQEGHPAWKAFTEYMAAKNGVDVAALKRDFTTMRDSPEAEMAAEFARRYKFVPTSTWTTNDGTRYDWFETHPFRHVERDSASHAHRLAVLEHVGDRISSKTGKPPIDELKNAAIAAGLDQWTVDAFLNVLSGKSANKIGTTDLGGEAGAAVEWYNGVFSAVMAGKMSVSGLTTAAETLATVRAWGGNMRLARAIAVQMGRDPNGLRAEARRMGLWAKEWADFTLDPNERGLSALKVYGNAILAGTRPVWNVQSEQAALVGLQYAKDFQNGTASEWDRDTLSNHLGFTKAEAEALYNRTAPPTAYTEMARRFASRTIAGRMTNPIDESAIRQRPWFRYTFPLTRFTLQRGREIAGYLKLLKDDAVQLAGKRDVESTMRILRDTGDLGNYMVGVGAGGVFANIIRSMLYNGIEDGLGLEWEKFNSGRLNYLGEGLISGSIGFLFGSIYWAQKNVEYGDHPLLAFGKISATVGVLAETALLAQSLHDFSTGEGLGTGRYSKMRSPGEMVYEWMETAIPALRAGGTASDMLQSYVPAARMLLPLSFGFSRDLELNAALVAQMRFLDEKHRGPGGGSPGDLDPADVAFFRNMDGFAKAMRAPDSPNKHEAARQYLLAAIQTNAKTPQEIHQSILGHQFARHWRGDDTLEAEFASRFPHHYRQIVMADARLQAWAASVYKPKR